MTFLYRLAGEPEVDAENSFSDVAESDYFYNSVRWAVANGITTGYGEGTFQPNKTCNRAMIVTFLMRYAEKCLGQEISAEGEAFPDVPAGSWYETAVKWAVANNITTGMGGKFNPTQDCTRGQMVTFLYRVESQFGASR